MSILRKREGLLFGLLFIILTIVFRPLSVHGQDITITVDTPEPAPEWALLQRELLYSSSVAAEMYYNEYFDERGYLLVNEIRWGGNDGPDDIMQRLAQWPILYALGGSERVRELYNKVWEGHLLQIAETTGTYISFIRDGMYYKEFHSKQDWLHIGEGLMMFNVMGLGDPYDTTYEKRVRRFAEFYTGEDPGAPNYDPEHKIIRSMFNGSRGPLMRNATAVDWAGDPSEIRNRYHANHGETNYEEFLYHFKNYDNTLGDHPLNLRTTSLAMNAYRLTGEEKYREWLLEYVDAWYDRMEANGWLIPTDVGLDGTIGGETGKWYGGTYGWSFTRDSERPPGSGVFHLNHKFDGFAGFRNAYMLTSDDRYLEAWRKQDDVMYDAGRMIDGIYHTPRMYGNPNWSRVGYSDDDGWYNFRPGRSQNNKLQLYYLSWKPDDRQRIESNTWLDFLEGNNPDYAVDAMRNGLAGLQSRLQEIQEDTLTFDTRLVDNPRNPVQILSLIHLMGGGIFQGRGSDMFFTRLRYFDPECRRAGVPEDVAALVEAMTDESVTVSLVNLNLVEARPVVVQGGGYAEHQLVAVTHDGVRTPVDSTSFQVLLEPGSGATLEIEMQRFVNRPTMDFPWLRRN